METESENNSSVRTELAVEDPDARVESNDNALETGIPIFHPEQSTSQDVGLQESGMVL
jgi:hypothetical protein